jgi:hypothetical protein
MGNMTERYLPHLREAQETCVEEMVDGRIHLHLTALDAMSSSIDSSLARAYDINHRRVPSPDTKIQKRGKRRSPLPPGGIPSLKIALHA